MASFNFISSLKALSQYSHIAEVRAPTYELVGGDRSVPYRDDLSQRVFFCLASHFLSRLSFPPRWEHSRVTSRQVFRVKLNMVSPFCKRIPNRQDVCKLEEISPPSPSGSSTQAYTP